MTKPPVVTAEPCWNCDNPVWWVGGQCICCGFEAERWPERLAAWKQRQREQQL